MTAVAADRTGARAEIAARASPATGSDRMSRSDPGIRIPTRRAALSLCACGHEPDAHEHYRPGSECGVCGPGGCSRFRQRAGRRAVPTTLRMLGRRSTLGSPAVRRRH